MTKYTLIADNNASLPLHYSTLREAKAALLEIFDNDAALEGKKIDPELYNQIDTLTDNESGVELHGHGVSETFLAQ